MTIRPPAADVNRFPRSPNRDRGPCDSSGTGQAGSGHMRHAVLIVALLASLATAPAAGAQISLSSGDTAYTQDFDTLAPLGSSSSLPPGWVLSEAGTGAD